MRRTISLSLLLVLLCASELSKSFQPRHHDKVRRSRFGNVLLKVFDVLCREVATLVNEMRQPGRYEVSSNIRGSSSGVYLYRLQAGHFIGVKKLLLVR